jgi:biopolymer transport protein ExbB
MKPITYISLFLMCITLFGKLNADTKMDAAREKLEASITELGELRTTIATEREPMAATLRRLENEVMELRRQRERMQRLVDNQSVDVTNLRAQIKGYEDEATYVSNLLSDFYNRLNAALRVAEIPLYQKELLAILNYGDSDEKSRRERLDTQVAGVNLALSRFDNAIGGMRIEGEAVLPTGEVSSGNFAIIGPITYYATKDGRYGGLVVPGPSESPTLIEFDRSAIPAISTFLKNGSGTVPVDSTLGRALAIASANVTLVEHFKKGGLWMYPILFFAVFSLIIAGIKIFQILMEKGLKENQIQEVLMILKDGKKEDALKFLGGFSGPNCEMLRRGIMNMQYSKELVEEFMMEIVLTTKPRLERGIAFIALSAAVAPLLGLLGTVTGMIETFKLLTLFGTGDAKSLSSGISQALVTTEFGLVAAIPALILAALTGRLVAAMLASLERDLITFANGLASIKETKECEVAA